MRTWLVSTLLSASLLEAQESSSPAPQPLRHMYHTTWTARNGMEYTPTGYLYQSSDGYIWFASRTGLIRFDGVRFARVDSLTSPLLKTDSLGVIRPMLVDRRGVLWLRRSDGGLLNYRDGSFSMAVPPDPRYANIYTGLEDGAGRIWLIIKDMLHVVDGGRVVLATLPAGVPNSGVTAMVRDTGQGLIFGTASQGLWRIDGNSAERIPEPEGRTQGVSPVFQTSDGRVWALGPHMLMVREHNGAWVTVRLNGAQIAPSSMVEQPRGQLWIGTQTAGLLRIVNGRIEQYSRRQGLSDVVVRAMTLDTQGNAWILTDAGLERLRPSPFTTLGLDEVPFEQSSRLLPDESRGLWVRSTDERVHHVTGGLVSGDTGAIRWTPIALPGTGNRFPIGTGRDGSLFFFSRGVGVGRLLGSRTSVLASESRLDAAVVRAVHEDSRGSVWIGAVTKNGGPGLARVTGSRVKLITLERTGLPGNVSTIAEDNRGDLWVNNTLRPIVYKLKGDSVVARLDSAAGIPAVVTTVVAQGLDTLWALTNRASFLRIIGNKATRVHFAGERPLLVLPWSTMVLEDDALWIATNDGIARLDVASLHAAADGRGPLPVPRFYGEADGLPNARTPFTAVGTIAVARDDRIWFSTSSGLAVYDKRLDVSNPLPPRVHVEEVVADGRQLARDEPIPPHPDRVDIHFTAISMRSPQHVRIEYMLEGADRGWVKAGPDRVATYTQLRAGGYRFRVRAWNEDGVPATTEGVMTLRVVPLWYETTVFRVFAILATLAIVPLAVSQVIQRRVQRRETELHARFDAALDERTRIARELHDTLLQGFSGITLQLHTVMHALTHAPGKAAERLGRILHLADNTLVDARQMIWDLRAPELEHQELSAALARAARELIVDAPIELRFNVRGEARRLPPLVESTALRVAREAATNAVRHARPRFIEIELAYSDTRLDVRVHDDGSGFEDGRSAERHHNGHWGIAGMRERAKRAGGAIDIRSTVDAGTTVSLQLPIAGASGR